MKRFLLPTVAAVGIVVLIAFWLSIIRVPAGADRWMETKDAWLRLAPGVHFKAPWERVTTLKGREFPLIFKGEIPTCEWDRIPFGARASGTLTPARLEAATPGSRLLKSAPEEAFRRGLNEAGLSLCLERLLDPSRHSEVERRITSCVEAAGFVVKRLEWSVDEKNAEQALADKRLLLPRIRPPHPTLFIGLDAADWMVMDRLIAAGRLPRLAALKQRSAWGPIVSEEPMLSPILWTSIATGKRPEKHGVLEFTSHDPATGVEGPVTSDHRRVKALWNILSERGRSVGFVGWWATFPAEWVEGVLVSERISYQLFGMEGKFSGMPGLISPFPSVPASFRSMKAEEIPYEQIKRFLNISKAQFDAAWEQGRKSKDTFENPINHLRGILASTETVAMAAMDLIRRGCPSLVAPYFEGTDTIGHRFAQYLPPRLPWVSPEDYDRFKDAYDAYYEFLDAQLGGIIAAFSAQFPSNGCIMVASDHGFKTGASRPKVSPEDMVLGAPQWHRKFGVFMLAGPGIVHKEIRPVSILDVAPTLLYLQGLPIPEDMDGALVREAFEPGILAAHPVERVPTYEPPGGRPTLSAEPRVAGADDRLKELRALGYIGGAAGSGAAPPPDSKDGASYTAYYNLGNAAKYEGKPEQAREYFKKAVAVNPVFGLAMFNLASLAAQAGNHEEAYTWLREALRVGREVPPLAAVHLVDEARLAGRAGEALDFLQTVESKYAGAAPYQSAVGIALLARGELQEAHARFAKALALDPYDVYAIEEDLKLAAEQRWTTPAEESLNRALKSTDLPNTTLKALGRLCLELGLLPEAKTFLNRALAQDDSDPEILEAMASVLGQTGDRSRAESLLQKALAVEPANPRLHLNYGALLINSGRLQDGYAQLKKAEAFGLRTPDLYNALGKAAFRLGRQNEARACLSLSLQMDAQQPDIRQMLESLGP